MTTFCAVTIRDAFGMRITAVIAETPRVAKTLYCPRSRSAIIASTTQSIIVWISGHQREACTELGQVEIGRRVKDAIDRSR